MRIAVIINMITPYQRLVFERLSERDDCDLLVVYETAREPNRQWRLDTSPPYRHVVLDSWSLDLAWLAKGSGMKLVSDIYLHVPKRPLSALRAFAPDAVVASGGGIWSSPTNVVALAGRKKYGWAFVPRWESFGRPRPTFPRRLAEPWVRKFMRSGDAWIAVGSRSRRDLVELGADPARIFIWPMIPAAAGWDDSISPRSSGPTRFLFVGQLIERKGIDVLLRAFADLNHAELLIAGDGPLREGVLAASSRDSRVTVHGHLEPKALDDLYRQADVFVLPSLYETWGLVVNEALGRGLPVVVTDQVGAADDLVEDGVNGLVVPAGSHEALADAMRRASKWTPEKRRAGQRLSTQKLKPFTFDNAAEAIVQACRCGLMHRSSA
jgi:glycosyltransferase involved in cell wall biosynthesis